MADQWFKFWGVEYLGDVKMDSLSAADRSCWLTLLCLASASDIPGVLKFVTESYLMMRSGIEKGSDEWELTKGILERLEVLQMLRNDNGVVTILNWNKRQKRASTVYERVKKYRQRNENVTNVTKRNESDNNRIEEKRIEENRREGRGRETPSQITMDFFEDVKNETGKFKELLLVIVAKGIPENLAISEIRKFCSYWREKTRSGKKERWETEKTFEVKRRLATWFQNVNKFNKGQASNKFVIA